MSLTQILAHQPRPRGRRRVADVPAERERHVQCAQLRLLSGLTVAQCATLMDVSPRTVHLWVARALAYDDPACDALRRAVAARN